MGNREIKTAFKKGARFHPLLLVLGSSSQNTTQALEPEELLLGVANGFVFTDLSPLSPWPGEMPAPHPQWGWGRGDGENAADVPQGREHLVARCELLGKAHFV